MECSVTVFVITNRDRRLATPWDRYTLVEEPNPFVPGETVDVAVPTTSAPPWGTSIVYAEITSDPVNEAAELATWKTTGYSPVLHTITAPGPLYALAWGVMHPIAVEVVPGGTPVYLASEPRFWRLPSDTLLPTGTRTTWTEAALADIGWNAGTATRAQMFAAVRDLPRLALWRAILDQCDGLAAFVGREARGGAHDRTVITTTGDHFIIAVRGGYRNLNRPGETVGGTSLATHAAELLSALDLGLYVWRWTETIDAYTGAGVAFASQARASFPEPYASRFAALTAFTEIAP